MPVIDNPLPHALLEDLLQSLVSVGREPELRIDDEGRWLVHLKDRWLRIAEVRQSLHEHQAFVKILQDKGVDLGWLAIPDLESQTPDLVQEARELESTLDKLEQRAFVAAQSLADDLLAEAQPRDFQLPVKAREHLADHVLRVLAGVVIDIETALPRSLRRLGQATFRVDGPPEKALGVWENGLGTPIDMKRLVIDQARLVGAFRSDTGEALAHLVLETLLGGRSVLPGLPVESTTDTGVVLRWSKPSLSGD